MAKQKRTSVEVDGSILAVFAVTIGSERVHPPVSQPALSRSDMQEFLTKLNARVAKNTEYVLPQVRHSHRELIEEVAAMHADGRFYDIPWQHLDKVETVILAYKARKQQLDEHTHPHIRRAFHVGGRAC